MQPFSYGVWSDKYNLRDKDGNSIDKDPEGMRVRVATALASMENPKERKRWTQQFIDVLDYAIPAGRIIANAGAIEHKSAVSTINCVVSGTIEDSLHDILSMLYESGMSLKAGCGIGYEFSSLRPKGSFVNGPGASTSGPLPFMDIYDKMCDTISSAGGRRGAQMGTFSITHPDVLDFIKAKRETGRLRKFNLSLLITEDFIQAVKEDKMWSFSWQGVPVGEPVRAVDVWNLIMKSTYDYAEPGFLLIDRINEYNNNWFCENIRATNPCVTGDTLILTKSGYVPIETVVDTKVKVWNGNEWSKVQPRVTGENQDVIDFEFSDGTKLACTPYHKFILIDGERIEAKDLHVGSKLAKFGFPVIEGDKKIGKKIAYTQGFYSGDGQADTKRIWLYETKCDLLDKLALSAWSDQSNHNQRIMATMDRPPLAKDFVPSVAHTISTRLNWLAGLMDSDGTVSEDGVVQIWSVDRAFLLNVKLMLNTLGATGNLTLGSYAGTKVIGDNEYDVQDCWRLGISATNVSRLRALGLDTNRLDITYEPQRDASRFIQVTFKRKRRNKVAKVYCFTEPKNHSGVFNGIMTANCGEQPLPPYGSCLLGSVNLTKLVVNPFTPKAYFNFDLFKTVVRTFTRLLDNVVELNGLPLPQQRFELIHKRRHGMGYLGLGSALTMLRIPYGSPQAIAFTQDISLQLAVSGFETGIELAREKGVAPIFKGKLNASDIPNSIRKSQLKLKPGREYKNSQLWSMSKYMEQLLDEDVFTPTEKQFLRNNGCRFTHHSSIAPTGTISASLGNNASSGIEPSFGQSFVRNVIKPGRDTKEAIEVDSFEFLEYKRLINPDATVDTLPDYFVTVDSLTPKQHVDMQAAAQKWVDSSISKTINVPTSITFEDFKQVYMYAVDSGLKGCTTFRFNPDLMSNVLVRKEDLANTTYRFHLEDGTHVDAAGDETIHYSGATHSAENLYSAIKEGLFGKF